MSFLFTLEDDSLAVQLPTIFLQYEGYIEAAEPLFELKGKRLEELARDLPKNQAQYMQWADEMKQVMKWLENSKLKLEAKYTKNYLQGQRALSQRDASTLIAGEREIIELNQLIIEATLIYSKLSDIVEGFKQMGWSLGNIVRLRVASLEDIII